MSTHFSVSTSELTERNHQLSTDLEAKQGEIEKLKTQLVKVELQRNQFRQQLQQVQKSGASTSTAVSSLDMGQKAQRILTLIEDGDLVESLDFVLRAVEDAVRIADEQALAAAAREAQAERQEFDRQPTIDSVFDALHELPDELQTIVDASSPDTRFDEDITSVRAKLQSLQTEDEVAEQGPLGLQPELAQPIERAKEALEQGGGGIDVETITGVISQRFHELADLLRQLCADTRIEQIRELQEKSRLESEKEARLREDSVNGKDLDGARKHEDRSIELMEDALGYNQQLRRCREELCRRIAKCPGAQILQMNEGRKQLDTWRSKQVEGELACRDDLWQLERNWQDRQRARNAGRDTARKTKAAMAEREADYAASFASLLKQLEDTLKQMARIARDRKAEAERGACLEASEERLDEFHSRTAVQVELRSQQLLNVAAKRHAGIDLAESLGQAYEAMNVLCGRRLAQRLEEARSGLWEALEQHHALSTVALREMTKKKLRLRRREMLLHQQLLHSQFDLQAAFETHFNEADRELHTEWQRMYTAQIDKLRTFMAQLQAHIDKVGDEDLAKTVNRLQARSDAMAAAGEIAQARRWENPRDIAHRDLVADTERYEAKLGQYVQTAATKMSEDSRGLAARDEGRAIMDGGGRST